MTPLERAANAIEHEFVELADPDGKVSAYGIAHRVARAVLNAIREPSEGMGDAGRAALTRSHLGGGTDDYVSDTWQAMIDAALSGGEVMGEHPVDIAKRLAEDRIPPAMRSHDWGQRWSELRMIADETITAEQADIEYRAFRKRFGRS